MSVALADLQQVAALKHLPMTCLERLSNGMVKRDYAPGEYILWEGDQATGIWFILRGQVKILKLSAAGRTQALCIAHVGKCFGACPLFNNQQANPANAQALDTVTLLILPLPQAQALLKDDPPLLQALLKIYSERLALLARLSESLGTWSVAARLNDCLLAHADLNEPRQVHLTHEKLAELAGTVREVASRHLADLAQQGLVELANGCIYLLQPEALQLPCLCK